MNDRKLVVTCSITVQLLVGGVNYDYSGVISMARLLQSVRTS